MAGGGKAQERLNKIVTVVAADMVAEVCSAYVMRPGEVLELFASKGLKPEAVHKTRLRVGEGLVGDIAAHARPLALAEAQAHPNFAYRPETGEEIFHSLMGVPILRGGRVLGVLVVQNRTPATTPKKRSRLSRRSPPCWPSWWPAASWSRARSWSRPRGSASCRCGSKASC
jgi:phosphotransferase system enzyme I (PtsP)